MSYLQDRRAKKKKFLKIAGGFTLLALLFYFRAGLFAGLSSAAGEILRPVLILGRGTGSRLGGLDVYFSSKSALERENEKLRSQLVRDEARMADYQILARENENLKEILLRQPEDKKFILAAVLAKPGVSPYDTFLLDLGAKDGAAIGNLVFAEGDIPIGRLASVTSDTAKAVLFSSTRERTPVVIHASLSVPADLLQKGESDIFWEIIGRGGGNFEMILPRDFTLVRGDPVALPGLRSYAVAVVETILSDQRDSFQKALLRSPVNLQDLKFVEVELE